LSAVVLLAIPLREIDLGDRRRPVDLAEVEKLAVSMKERGQLQPIEVRKNPAEEGRFLVVLGAHRVSAAWQLGWKTILGDLFEGSADEAALREIDENLCRHELNPYDQANFMAERREIWERLHGQIKRGGDKRAKAQIEPLLDALKRPGFIKTTAANFGMSVAGVKRALIRKANIDPKVWAALAGTDAAKNAALLDKIRKIDFDLQQDVLAIMSDRGCKMDVAVRLATGSPIDQPADQAEKRLAALRAAWKRAESPERLQFLKEIGAKQK
jgi:ParB family chromosome partitioning protein